MSFFLINFDVRDYLGIHAMITQEVLWTWYEIEICYNTFLCDVSRYDCKNILTRNQCRAYDTEDVWMREIVPEITFFTFR